MEQHSECNSNEEMRAALEVFNRCEKSVREKCVFLSMDVKALYPSMQRENIVAAVKEKIEMSELEIENVDWREIVKYIAVMVLEEIIEKEGLMDVIPKRKNKEIGGLLLNT